MEYNKAPITVRQLNLYVKSLLENDPKLNYCLVSGEVTNFKSHYSSGHLYFSLSDGVAAIKCVMFKGYASRCAVTLKDGMKIVAGGRVSIYEKDGGYQLYVETVDEDGVGDKLLKLKLLKEKLAAEGMFDADSKRPIPAMPKRIAVITSGSGAALQDILNVLSRRYPLCEVVLCNASVQGELAAKELINALDRVYNLSEKIDTIIIGRGGGSKEDLDAFNDEELARKIYASPIPVISAVGHEIDVSVCDMVADLRAPTPSAAAELAVPNVEDLIFTIDEQKNKCGFILKRLTEFAEMRLKAVASQPIMRMPNRFIDERIIEVDKFNEKIASAVCQRWEKASLSFSAAATKIEALSPMKTMARGYAFAEASGKPLISVNAVENGDTVKLRLIDGNISCTVTHKEN